MIGKPHRQLIAFMYKDFKLLYREPQVYFILLMPLLYAVIYSFVGREHLAQFEIMQICIGLTVSLCPIFIQAILIVSDKENREIRALMRSGASLGMMLASKALLAGAATLTILLLCAVALSYQPAKLLPALAHLLLVILTFLALGTVLGIWYRTLQDVIGRLTPGIISVLIVILPIMFSTSQGGWMHQVYQYYPVGLLSSAILAGEQQNALPILLQLLTKCGLWTLVAGGFAYWFYRREAARYRGSANHQSR